MNRPNLFQTLLLALAMICIASGPVQAQGDSGTKDSVRPKWDGSGRRAGGHIGKEFETIKQILTPDQTSQFDAIMEQSMQEARPLRQQLIQLQSTSGDNPDAKTQSKIDDLKAQMREHKKQTKEKLMALLTPEQKTKLATLRSEQHQKKEQAASPKAASTPSDADESSMSLPPDGNK